ncbi:MAG: cytidylate kinase, partial [Candidatus Aminicenantes bacterium]|nr:cytidylate kinase [Candidatus Aminicenantes bacterium]
GNAIIAADASELPRKRFGRVAVISQTTRCVEDLQKLVHELIPLSSEMCVINTICNATTIRQNSTLKLARHSDLMIVIGGKNSSNTKMLAKISENFVETYHIETDYEIDCKWFKNKENVGITAGASTPDWVIVEVYNKILECMGDKNNRIQSVEEIPGFKEDNNG